jgi:hypothetical protein
MFVIVFCKGGCAGIMTADIQFQIEFRQARRLSKNPETPTHLNFEPTQSGLTVLLLPLTTIFSR